MNLQLQQQARIGGPDTGNLPWDDARQGASSHAPQEANRQFGHLILAL